MEQTSAQKGAKPSGTSPCAQPARAYCSMVNPSGASGGHCEKGVAVNTGMGGTASKTSVARPNQLQTIRRMPMANEPRTTSIREQ